MKTAEAQLVITPEAETFIDELGVRQPYNQIVEHLRQTIPGLHEINVVREPPHDLGGDDILLIRGYRDPLGLEDDATDRTFDRWMIDTLPPSVGAHFVFFSVETPRSAR